MNTEEYVSLREEILQCQSNIVNTTGFVLASLGVFVAAAFEFRNPILALFPLLILYLGHVVLFNNAQTTARNATYIKVFWESRSPDFGWETRLDRLREKTQEAAESAVREQWMSPLAQMAFVVAGAVCIVISGWISYWTNANPQSMDLVSPNTPLSIVFFTGFLLISTIGWGVFWFRTRDQRRVIYKRDSLVEVLESKWSEVKESEGKDS